MALAVMTDDQLKDYIPIYGDRLALKFFINNHVKKSTETDSGRSKRKESVLDRLRKKLKLDGRALSTDDNKDSLDNSSQICTNKEMSKLNGNINAFKDSRSIRLGLISVSNKGYVKQIKLKEGGGLRNISVKKSTSILELKEMAKDLFFQDGVSKIGSLSEFDFSILDFQEKKVVDTCTVEDMYNSAKLTTVKCYLGATRQSLRLESTTISSIADFFDVQSVFQQSEDNLQFDSIFTECSNTVG